MTELNNQSWEQRFDEQFPYAEVGQRCMQEPPENKSIKSFISQLLSEVINELDKTDFRLDTNIGKYKFKQQLKNKYGIK